MIITPGSVSGKQLHAYLLGSIAPRPICFASTMDKEGNANLAPFSFFNVFGSNPPICVFSPARRVRDNTTKHTLENIIQTREVVINVVTFSIVQQTSLSSCEYPQHIDEFVKAGLTPLPSDLVKPYRVKESPVNLECKVINIVETGKEGGAGNLIICEIVKIHIDDSILDSENQIDPHKIDLVARMGKDYYCRASGGAIFEVPKPNLNLGIGFDALPQHIKDSEILTGNDLGILANSSTIPQNVDINDEKITEMIPKESINEKEMKTVLHKYAKELLEKGDVETAWKVLLYKY